jgi:hypothetical protein
MTYDEIQEFRNYINGYTIKFPHILFKVIKNRYKINEIREPISIRKAIEFIKDVWEVEFYFYDKFVRYLRKFDLLIEEEKEQRNWKLKVTYASIFKLMNMPLYELFLVQQRNKENK